MIRRTLVLIFVAGMFLVVLGYVCAIADPVMREAKVAMPGWPAGQRPIRVALISDVHVQGPDMPPARLARIVGQVNAQHPDLILLAGDFVGSRRIATRHYSDAEIAAPLGGLHAPLGVYAALGNHDYWRDGASMKAALERSGIRVLVNDVVRAGPVTLAGADDEHTEHADIGRIARTASGMPRPLLLFTHSPDVVPRLPPQFALVLAGHTHCGQIVLPLIGALASSSRYGERYRCGIIHEGKRTIIVTSGLGASVLPFRLGATPDWWMVTLGP